MSEIEDKLASLYPMLKKIDVGSYKNMVGTPRNAIRQVGKLNGIYKKMAKL